MIELLPLPIENDSLNKSEDGSDFLGSIVAERPNLKDLSERFISFLSDHPDWFHRSCLQGHITASGIVMDFDTDMILLIHHNKLERWLQPGGHADGDTDTAYVAWKEVNEETGLTGEYLVTPAVDLDIHPIPEHKDVPEHLHLDVRYLILASAAEELAPNNEVSKAEWVSFEDGRVDEAGLRALVEHLCSTREKFMGFSPRQ